MATPIQTKSYLRTVLGHIPMPLVTIASLIDDCPDGMVAASFVAISLEPPLVGVAIQDTSATWPRLRQADSLGISILTEKHSNLVRQLSGPQHQRFTGVGWHTDGESVFLDDSSVAFSTRIVDEIPAGDHILAILEVEDICENPSGRPLVFHHSQCRTVA